MASALVPFSLEAEEAVIASILVDPASLDEVFDLKASDFHDERCGWIYSACRACDTINHVTVAQELERRGHPGLNGYLSKVVCDLPSSVYVRHYADIVAQKAYQRKVIAAAGEIAALGYKGGEDVYEKIRRLIDGLQPQGHEAQLYGPEELANTVMAILSDWEDQKEAVRFGYPNLDRATGGMHGGDLTILGARTSVGKSQILQEVALFNVYQGRCVLFASLEMSLRQLLERQIVTRLRKDIVSLRNGKATQDDWKLVADLAQEISTKNLHVTSCSLSLEAIAAKAKALRESKGMSLLCFDHVQFAARKLGKGYGDTLREKTGYVTNWAKSLAQELDVPVLAACQLNRATETRDGHRPMLADLQESGSIEQDADMVLLLHRPELYENCKPQDKGVMLIRIAKDRQGGRDDVIRLKWQVDRRQYGEELGDY